MKEQQKKMLYTPSQYRFLKGSAHHLKPCVQVGKKGYGPGLVEEIDRSLCTHELIKVQWLPAKKAELEEDIVKIVEQTGATHIATIGNIAILFRQKEQDSKFDLLNLSEDS